MSYHLHPVQWNHDTVARFWNFASTSPAYRDEYFSKQVGKGIVRFLQQRSLCQGQVLDYGCGRGDLIQELLRTGCSCAGADYSADSVASVNSALKDHSLWCGAKVVTSGLPWPDESFDLIVCLETIEHVLDDDLPTLLGELRRVLRPTGRLFVTTPNAEPLARAEVACPECGAIFHRVQHVRSFQMENLSALLADAGFRTLGCGALDFNIYQAAWLARLRRRLARWRAAWQGRLWPEPHLYWIGTKAC